ncbi:MAG: 30S ribosomal protein S20 [Peptococcaceae bacterium]|nr:30S ribosomal protein S20 [Peptococcaceae bacterium]
MPNIKSAKKRVIVAETRRQRNMAAKSAMRTQLKKFAAVVAAGNKEEAQAQLVATVKMLDKTASKGIIHKNAADRKKAQLYKHFNNM